MYDESSILQALSAYMFSEISDGFICSHVQTEKRVIPPKGSDVGATDESKVDELEDKVKDLEQKRLTSSWTMWLLKPIWRLAGRWRDSKRRRSPV